jgi:hypothetical protein
VKEDVVPVAMRGMGVELGEREGGGEGGAVLDVVNEGLG